MTAGRATRAAPTFAGGRYRAEAVLGSGATSTVYRARDDVDGRVVALKVLHGDFLDDRDRRVARFLRQADIASRVRHPSLVQIFAAGTIDGDTYVSMELVVGHSLAALLGRELALDPSVATRLLDPVMDALALAHRRGIVHRDLKPENIVVSRRDGGVERGVLIDFGLARRDGDGEDDGGRLVGTPYYMSPEQAAGASRVGPASDVWAMGVLLYRTLTGELPFTAGSPDALFRVIARGEHVPLRKRAPWLGSDVASWVERALAPDPSARYADMGAMRRASERLLDLPSECGP